MSKREDLIRQFLADLGVSASEENIDKVDLLIAQETNLREWPDDLGAQTWTDEVRSAREAATRMQVNLEVALRDLEQLRAAK